MENTPDEADKRFRAEAFRLRLREDLISLRVRFLHRGVPTDTDLRGLADVHREVMHGLELLKQRHAGRAQPAASTDKGLADSAVEVVAYNPGWPDAFEAESAKIRASLGSLAVDVHHVGSTSVPGMPAKPIIDMAVAVEPSVLRSYLPECMGAMTAAGYAYYGNWGHHGGHFFAKSTGTLRTSAAQLHAADSEDLADLLGFRDAARADPSVLSDYSQVKVALASVFARDRGLYVWCKGHWLTNRVVPQGDDRAWGLQQLRAGHPTLVQLGFRSLVARLRPRFTGRGMHPMAIRNPGRTGT
ncbi:MAG TPA: GrpB family protein [Opitutaceae bacterium]|jgi:GrpB-like predicted nucleotidyltransferase (UPF0157 family)|nr:GrpB family protein [Opitutaceae bacterium]